MDTLTLRNVDVEYQVKRGDFKAVQDLSLDVRRGEFICIIGRSGCGKTTTLYAVAGLNPVRSGKILLDGNEITGPGAERGMVFQSDSVFPWLTVEQNVTYGLKLKGMKRSEIKPIVSHYLNLVGLWYARNLYPRELSGGMRKRVDLARAFANDPDILLMDEPFGSLDAMTKESLQVSILELWQETQKTVLFVTHDVEEALFLAQRTVVMKGPPGRVERITEVPFEYPRDVSLKIDPKFLSLRADLMDALAATGQKSE
jgi:ABC-type nitrate/sulfonate/bicarbonate transport system ATPase subunit